MTKNLFFTKISHEIAYTEYAMGLVNLLYQKGYYGDATEEYLQEVREIINALVGLGFGHSQSPRQKMPKKLKEFCIVRSIHLMDTNTH